MGEVCLPVYLDASTSMYFQAPASRKSGSNPITTLLLLLLVLLQWTSVLGRSTQERLHKVKSLRPHIVIILATTSTVNVPAPFLLSDTPKSATKAYNGFESLPLTGLRHTRWAAIAGYQAYRHRNLFAAAVNLLLGRDVFPAHPSSGLSHTHKESRPTYWYPRTLDPPPIRLTLPAAPMPIPEPRDFVYKLEYNHTPYHNERIGYDTIAFAMNGYYPAIASTSAATGLTQISVIRRNGGLRRVHDFPVALSGFGDFHNPQHDGEEPKDFDDENLEGDDIG